MTLTAEHHPTGETAMKFGFLAAAAALALGSQTASAQPLIIQSGGYSPSGFSIGGVIGRPGGISIGGFYSNAPQFYAPPVYARPVYVPVRPVYGPPVNMPYRGAPYHRHSDHHHHPRGYRW